MTWASEPPEAGVQGAPRLWEPRVRVELSLEPHAPEPGAQGQRSQEALGSQRSCALCSPPCHLFVPPTACPWRLGSDPRRPQRTHRIYPEGPRPGPGGQEGRPVCPSPVLHPQRKDRPGLQEGGWPGWCRVCACLSMVCVQSLCEGILCVRTHVCMCVCVCVCVRENLYVRVCTLWCACVSAVNILVSDVSEGRCGGRSVPCEFGRVWHSVRCVMCTCICVSYGVCVCCASR